jgi:hypothetical protein
MWTIVASVAIAVVSALVSIFVAIYTTRRAHENQRAVEQLRADLAEEKSTKDARREYEFHARQRVYAEYEPLRFQLLEVVETAKCQIETMSEQALDHKLERLGSTPTGNYWLLGTIYHLLHPAAVFRMAQRRLTLVDLRIEPTIHVEYTLAKKGYLALSHDARIADIAALTYTPYVDGWKEKREANPAHFRRQGLPLGRLDNAVDTLIIRQDGGDGRLATFGEFESQFGTAKPEDVSGPVGAARDLFLGFNPTTRPVLWRLLLAQFVIYKALLASIQGRRPALHILEEPWHHVSPEEREVLGLAPNERRGELASEFVDAERYLQLHVTPDVRSISTS